jgi:hypothetical protein
MVYLHLVLLDHILFLYLLIICTLMVLYWFSSPSATFSLSPSCVLCDTVSVKTHCHTRLAVIPWQTKVYQKQTMPLCLKIKDETDCLTRSKRPHVTASTLKSWENTRAHRQLCHLKAALTKGIFFSWNRVYVTATDWGSEQSFFSISWLFSCSLWGLALERRSVCRILNVAQVRIR